MPTRHSSSQRAAALRAFWSTVPFVAHAARRGSARTTVSWRATRSCAPDLSLRPPDFPHAHAPPLSAATSLLPQCRRAQDVDVEPQEWSLRHYDGDATMRLCDFGCSRLCAGERAPSSPHAARASPCILPAHATRPASDFPQLHRFSNWSCCGCATIRAWIRAREAAPVRALRRCARYRASPARDLKCYYFASKCYY